jgi:murein DD-endopeptidase MepM/ murein hydrolase activator NlpD
MNSYATFLTILKVHQHTFHPVVSFNPDKEKLLPLDFTENNKELPGNILSDTNRFTAYIHKKLQHSGAKFGLGGYAEYRSVYSRSKVFDAKVPGEEPRRLHLGVDIWGEPDTAVMAPLDGTVHSFAFNDHFGDYGATIILSHQLEGFGFYTLYGHLSLNSIKNLKGGEQIKKGEIFAAFGIPEENGHWPPHLHFQIILDLENWSGDYPGVCKYSEREKYLANCPDPDWILQLNQFL